MNAFAHATLADLDAALADGTCTPADALAVLDARAAKGGDSFKGRRAANAARMVRECGRIDVKLAFAGAKKTPATPAKPAAKSAAKPAKAAKTAPADVNALAAAIAKADPAMVAAIAAFLRVK